MAPLPERGEHAAQISTPNWKCPVFYDDDDDDDDEYSIQYREYLENSSNAIAPEEPDNSLKIPYGEIKTQLLIAQKEEAGIQLQAEEYDLMAAATDLDEMEEVNANCILMANLQQVSSSGTQTDSAPVYDLDGSAEVHESYDNNETFNMFTQEEQYTELLEPIPESQLVPQNDNNVISEVTDVEQDGETLEQHYANFEETQDPYVEVALQAPSYPDYIPGPEEPEQAPPSPDYVPCPE
nr:hypothetical protein [Tanacetum cinerariifolium]